MGPVKLTRSRDASPYRRRPRLQGRLIHLWFAVWFTDWVRCVFVSSVSVKTGCLWRVGTPEWCTLGLPVRWGDRSTAAVPAAVVRASRLHIPAVLSDFAPRKPGARCPRDSRQDAGGTKRASHRGPPLDPRHRNRIAAARPTEAQRHPVLVMGKGCRPAGRACGTIAEGLQ